MVDEAIQMAPTIGSDGELTYCAVDPETSPAQPPPPPERPVLAFLILATAAGMILLAITDRLK